MKNPIRTAPFVACLLVSSPLLAQSGELDENSSWWQRERLSGDWGGSRSHLEDLGVSIDLTVVQDFFSTVSGGADLGSSYSRYAEIGLGFDMQRLVGVEGLTGFVNAYHTAGAGVSTNLGDFQGASNIENEQADILAEVWFEQILMNETGRLKVGKVDANSEFAYTENGGEFLNSSMGVTPTAFVLPTFPAPAWAVIFEMAPTDNTTARVGLFDGTDGASNGGTHGPSILSGRPSSAFWIAEVGMGWGEAHVGHVGIGGWTHTASIDRFDGGEEDNTSGTYLVLDQHLWGSGTGHDLAGFAQVGTADEAVSEVGTHLGVGFVYSNDNCCQAIGVGATLVEFSDEPGAGFTEDKEVILEAFWRFSPVEWLSIKPDMQYVANPGGDDTVDPALALGVRVEWVL